ncbi:MAG: DUF4288 domain-containing protein [Verrucomicrobiaceae bacterium]|nr:MAG: DUF4288 domain-containing protein [Verrucomicrobiaceae bacterium]
MLRTYHPLQPSPTGFYLASILECTSSDVSGDDVQVWENTHLIQAESPKAALEEAIRIGEAKEREYQGEGGCICRVSFGGITRLSPVHENLESGAEIHWLDLTGINESVLAKRVAGKTVEEAYAFFDQINEEDSEYPPSGSI